MKISITNSFEVTPEDVKRIMVAALQGIKYWCNKVEIDKLPDNSERKEVSDVISSGGSLTLYDFQEADMIWHLDQNKFLTGIELEMERGQHGTFKNLMNNLDTEIADCIIQFALFGELWD